MSPRAKRFRTLTSSIVIMLASARIVDSLRRLGTSYSDREYTLAILHRLRENWRASSNASAVPLVRIFTCGGEGRRIELDFIGSS